MISNNWKWVRQTFTIESKPNLCSALTENIYVKWEKTEIKAPKIQEERKPWIIYALTNNEWSMCLHEVVELTRSKSRTVTSIIQLFPEETTIRDCILSIKQIDSGEKSVCLSGIVLRKIRNEVMEIFEENNAKLTKEMQTRNILDLVKAEIILRSKNMRVVEFSWKPLNDLCLYIWDLEKSFEVKDFEPRDNLSLWDISFKRDYSDWGERKLIRKYTNQKQVQMEARFRQRKQFYKRGK